MLCLHVDAAPDAYRHGNGYRRERARHATPSAAIAAPYGASAAAIVLPAVIY